MRSTLSPLPMPFKVKTGVNFRCPCFIFQVFTMNKADRIEMSTLKSCGKILTRVSLKIRFRISLRVQQSENPIY